MPFEQDRVAFYKDLVSAGVSRLASLKEHGHPYIAIPPHMGIPVAVHCGDSQSYSDILSEQGLQERQDARNIHRENLHEECESSESISSDALPVASDRVPEMRAAHIRGECNPCAYFWQKADGCRQGNSCEFCHLCDEDALRRWKRTKKQKKKVEALTAEGRSIPSKKKGKNSKAAQVELDVITGDPMHVNLDEGRPSGAHALTGAAFRPYFHLKLNVIPYQCVSPRSLGLCDSERGLSQSFVPVCDLEGREQDKIVQCAS